MDSESHVASQAVKVKDEEIGVEMVDSVMNSPNQEKELGIEMENFHIGAEK